MQDNKEMTGMVIHGFAVAHAVTAAVLAQTIVGDEAALTTLTVAMIISVAKMNGANWDSGEALAFLGIFIGGYLGSRGVAFLIKWIPGLGNAANAAVTFGTTEVLGWATYLFVKTGKKNPGEMTQAEKDELWKKAKSMKEEEKEGKQIYDSMSESDKREYKRIMEQLRAKDLDDSKRNDLLDELENISRKYV